MSRFALRAEVTEGFRSQLDDFLSKVADAYIVAYEDVSGENPHVHCILDCVHGKTEKSVRSHFSRSCPEHKGNKMYSLKKCDDDYEAYIRYICKGKGPDQCPVIWTRQGLLYTDEKIAEAHRMYYVNQGAVIANAKKRRKVESGNIVEQVERLCKARGIKAFQREDVAMVYIDLFRDARKGINVFAARAVVNTVCCLLDDPDCVRKTLAQRISEL